MLESCPSLLETPNADVDVLARFLAPSSGVLRTMIQHRHFAVYEISRTGKHQDARLDRFAQKRSASGPA